MKAFKFEFNSPNNIISSKEIIIKANNIGQAQDRFVEYLKEIGLWEHMWKLTFEASEVEVY